MSRQDAIGLVLITVIWGLNWPIMKFGIGQMPPFTFRAVTIAGGLVMLALFATAQRQSLRLPRADWAETARLSLTNTVGWYALSILGLSMLSSGRSAILAYTLPVWAALIGTFRYGERQGLRLGIAVCAALAGVLLLLVAEWRSISGNPIGALVMLCAAAIWAVGTHQLRRRRTTVPIVVLTFWMTLGAFVLCLALAAVLEWRPLWLTGRSLASLLSGLDMVGWLTILYNSVLAYGVAQVLWFRLASGLPPVVSALSVMLIPVVGVLSGQWLLGEQPSPTDLAALVAILIAIAVTLLPTRKVGAG